MRRMTLAEIHEVNLEILKEIHSFCQTHGIRYGLAYGTLIGAIRHHGFIPWDDDADVLMPAEDYQRFVCEYKDSDRFKLYAPEKRNSWLLYGRLCEMKKTYFGQVIPWTSEHPGIGVDIFPYEMVNDDKSNYMLGLGRLQKLRNCSFAKRSDHILFKYLKRISRDKPLIDNVANFFRQIKYFPFWPVDYFNADKNSDAIVAQYLAELNDLDSDKFQHCGNLRCLIYEKKEWLPKSWISTFCECSFEGTCLMIPVYYDELLKNYYGDYMKLPPEDQRGGHDTCQTMMWRNK